MGLCIGACRANETTSSEPAEEPPSSLPSESPPSKEKIPPGATKATIGTFEYSGEEDLALREIGALPAWSAVHERFSLLERREEVGFVYGSLVGNSGDFRLVDETVGDGALSIPVSFPSTMDVQNLEPGRLLLEGAWRLDDNRRWQWQVKSAQLLSALDPPIRFQSLDSQKTGLIPQQRQAPKSIKRASHVANGGGAIAFSILGTPDRVRDGWLIADVPGGPAVARLFLPGERPVYGNQSVYSEDERWTLQRGRRYWLEIKRFRRPALPRIPTFQAISLPSPYKKSRPEKSGE